MQYVSIFFALTLFTSLAQGMHEPSHGPLTIKEFVDKEFITIFGYNPNDEDKRSIATDKKMVLLCLALARKQEMLKEQEATCSVAKKYN